MKRVLEKNLAVAKDELAQRKEKLRIMVANEIDSSFFEKKAIAELVAILELKTSISVMECDLRTAELWSDLDNG